MTVGYGATGALRPASSACYGRREVLSRLGPTALVQVAYAAPASPTTVLGQAATALPLRTKANHY
eukprot:1197926-Rhodomonas_salina.3